MPCHKWRLLRAGFMPGELNMALDEALLESVSKGDSLPVFRLYRWEPATVSLGYFQKGPNVVNLAACQAMGIKVVRRITGGRAVLHDKEVTYSVISAERSALFPGGVLENYKVIAGVLQRALQSIGLNAELSPGRSRGQHSCAAQQSACFTAPSNYELEFEGCKVTGSAQKRNGDFFLQHGSIPVDLDLRKLFCALNTYDGISPEEGQRLLEFNVGWLNRWLPESVSVDVVEECLLTSFAACLDVQFLEQAPTSEEWRRARTLLVEKYGNPDWVLKGIK